MVKRDSKKWLLQAIHVCSKYLWKTTGMFPFLLNLTKLGFLGSKKVSVWWSFFTGTHIVFFCLPSGPQRFVQRLRPNMCFFFTRKPLLHIHQARLLQLLQPPRFLSLGCERFRSPADWNCGRNGCLRWATGRTYKKHFDIPFSQIHVDLFWLSKIINLSLHQVWQL